MASESIVARLRLRDLTRFRRNAQQAEHAIKEIGDAAREANSPLNQFGGALTSLMDNFPDFTGRTRIFGFAIGTVATAFVAVIPLAIGLGGALTALAGSLGAAALGAGVLAVGLGGLAVPMGALGLVAFQAFQAFSKVNTAFQAYQKAVASFGASSKQADTALSRLNGTAMMFGGTGIVKVVEAWDRLQKSFAEANRGTLQIIIATLGDLLVVAEELMPVFAFLAETAAGVMREGFQQLGAALTSSGMITALHELGGAFQQIGPVLIQSVINLLTGLVTLASRATPIVSWFATQILRASEAFSAWANGGDLSGITSQFQSWWRLLGAIGGLLVTILSGGATEGQNMVDQLTAIVTGWNDFLKTTEGKGKLASFFKDSADMTRAFLGVLAGVTAFIFKLGRAALPLYTAGFNAMRDGTNQLMEALAPMEPFLDNILLPLLKGLAEGVLAGVVGAFKFLIGVVKIVSTVLGELGKLVGPGLKPVFEALGQVIGFLFGGAILRVLGNLGRLNIILRPLAAGFRLLLWPINRAGQLVGWLFGRIGALIGVFGRLASTVFPPLQRAIFRVLDWLTGAGSRFFDAGVRIWTRLREGIMRAIGSGLGFAGDIGKGVANAAIGFLNSAIPNKIPVPFGPDIDIDDNPIPALASGGTVLSPGSWISGEAGPELNTLTTGGRVNVVPLAPGVMTQSTNATLEPGGKRTIVSKVYLKGRQIAEAVAEENDDEDARK